MSLVESPLTESSWYVCKNFNYSMGECKRGRDYLNDIDLSAFSPCNTEWILQQYCQLNS